jgi:hypothetical protein
MNRDDRLSRPPALPPSVQPIEDVDAVFPIDPPAGTWIATNDSGITLAILNWQRLIDTPKLRSRGEVIPALIGGGAERSIISRLTRYDLDGLWPFRLFGFFVHKRRIREWRWNGSRLMSQSHPWKRGHWFSSGMSDVQASRSRSRIVQSMPATNAGTVSWLRKLHREHGAVPGPFSVCVHRKDAATLSYTEIEVLRTNVVMKYAAGPPCMALTKGNLLSIELPISTARERIPA